MAREGCLYREKRTVHYETFPLKVARGRSNDSPVAFPRGSELEKPPGPPTGLKEKINTNDCLPSEEGDQACE